MQKGTAVADIHSPVLDAEQRSWHYWFVDGLPNLVAGTACLLIGFFLLTAQARPRKPFVLGFGVAAMVLYGVLLFRMKQVIEWLKARITYPRTGYAAPPYFTNDNDTLPFDLTTLSLSGTDAKRSSDVERLGQDRRRRAWLVIALLLLAVGATWFIESRWICLVVGLVASFSLWWGTRDNERAAWIEMIAFPFVGFYLLIFPVAQRNRMTFFVLGGGLALVLSGAFSLVRYLRHNRVLNA